MDSAPKLKRVNEIDRKRKAMSKAAWNAGDDLSAKPKPSGGKGSRHRDSHGRYS